MKLTKLERHMAYMIMMEEAIRPGLFYYKDCLGYFNSNRFGFCGMIRMLFDFTGDDKEMPNTFPELFAKKPNEYINSYWFPRDKEGWQSRISLLRQCITETEDAWPK